VIRADASEYGRFSDMTNVSLNAGQLKTIKPEGRRS
jgi:hypothetical protein